MRQQRTEPAAIEADIARLRSLALDALRRRWRAVFGRTPPAALSKDLLGRMIAWRLQEQAFGGLDRESLTFLDGLARHGGLPRRQLKPGTVLVRDYDGQHHTVTVAADGFNWQGTTYASLSAIARAITGTRHWTLRYPYEVRKAEDYFCDLPDLTIAPDLLTLARHIVDSKATDFDCLTFRDRYEEALLAHLKAKQAGTVQERKPRFAAPHRVINLMEALRRSVAEDKKLAALLRGAAPARKRA